MTKRLPCTEYPFLNPPCTPEISPMSSDNLLNLEFRIEVNNFPMLEVRQIEELNTDEINLVELLDNIDNQVKMILLKSI
jgi:hypothetical protein